MTKRLTHAMIATTFSLFVGAGLAPLAHAENDCQSQAAEKKLSGAAKTSFLAKCEKNAAASTASKSTDECEKKAGEKKLAGAARASFVKKCAKDMASASTK